MKGIYIRAILQKQKVDTAGTCPILICITAERKRSYKTTGFRVPAKDWDAEREEIRKSFTNSMLINSRIKSLIAQMEASILKQQLQGQAITRQRVRILLRSGEQSTEIYDYAHKLIDHLEKKFAPGTILIYNNEINHLNDFAPGITFSEITPEFLRKYESYLIDLGISGNSIHKNWKIIKRVFNCAINDGITENYPFKKYDNPKYRQTDRTYLSLDEVDKIEQALEKPLPEGMIRTGYYFLLGCYSGLRYSDWKRFNYAAFIHGDRMVLRAKKNGELISMNMHTRLRAVIEKIRFIGPVDEDQTCNEYLKALARIAKVDKRITTHCARHSFAIRCAELGISIETTAELMGINIRSCQEYYKVTKRKLDSEFAKWDGV